MDKKDRNKEKEDSDKLDRGPLKDEHMNQYGKTKPGDKKDNVRKKK